jgi:hypothetical protein
MYITKFLHSQGEIWLLGIQFSPAWVKTDAIVSADRTRVRLCLYFFRGGIKWCALCMWNLITDSWVKECFSQYRGALELEMSVGRYFALDHHKMIILSSPRRLPRAAAVAAVSVKCTYWSRKLFLSLAHPADEMTREQRAACAFPAYPAFFPFHVCVYTWNVHKIRLGLWIFEWEAAQCRERELISIRLVSIYTRIYSFPLGMCIRCDILLWHITTNSTYHVNTSSQLN